MSIYLIGLAMGILSGLAIGGGSLLVPSLVILMGISQHKAQGICLASFIPTALVAVVTHYRHGHANIRLAIYLTFGALLGAAAGASLANHTDALIMCKLFGWFLISMGLYELLSRSHHSGK